MELMTTKKGPTLNPGAVSLYIRTEKAPDDPVCRVGAGDWVRPRVGPPAATRLRSPAADGPVPLMLGLDLRELRVDRQM